jgi:hypothetical protein
MSNADYGSPSYWVSASKQLNFIIINSTFKDERYSYEADISFDWYQDYEALKPFLSPFLHPNKFSIEILIPGCGNSCKTDNHPSLNSSPNLLNST